MKLEPGLQNIVLVYPAPYPGVESGLDSEVMLAYLTANKDNEVINLFKCERDAVRDACGNDSRHLFQPLGQADRCLSLVLNGLHSWIDIILESVD